MLTIYKVAPHTYLRRLKGKFENHVIRPPNKNTNAFHPQRLSCHSMVCATPCLHFFFPQPTNAHLGKCYLGSSQFLESQHASFLSSEESSVLITLMKAFTCHQVHKNRKSEVVANTLLKEKLLYHSNTYTFPRKTELLGN